jgi:hypothetical protein
MRTTLLTALLALLVTATSFAAPPVKNAKYTGQSTDASASALAFNVSKDGKSVSEVRFAASPNRCGAGGPRPRQSSGRAPISRGRFTAKVRFRTTEGAVYATAKVTGQFLKGGRARGTVTTKFRDAESKYCNGTFQYTASAE